MNTSDNNLFKTIDSTMLTPLVRQALNSNNAEVIDWRSDSLYGASGNSTIVHFSGNARDQGKVQPWSLILKTIRPDSERDDPTSLRYWKREALAYQSGLLNDLPGRIRAPRCHGIIEHPDQEMWLWLEEILDVAKGKWSLEQYGNIARHVGEFNGIFFGRTSALSHPWMTKNPLRSWVGTDAPILPPDVLAHPLVARFIPSDIYGWMQGIWLEHNAWLDLVERQQKALAHLDVFRRNAFARHNSQNELQTILIDWAFVGAAALGEEIAPLVAGSLNFMEFDSAPPHILDQFVFEGYLEGLRSTGWQGDPRVVRFAYAVGSVLKYSVGVYGVAYMVAGGNQHNLLQQMFGHPVDELVDVWGRTMGFLVKLSDEARELASQII